MQLAGGDLLFFDVNFGIFRLLSPNTALRCILLFALEQVLRELLDLFLEVHNRFSPATPFVGQVLYLHLDTCLVLREVARQRAERVRIFGHAVRQEIMMLTDVF